jgi:phosphoribosylformimino-5-aminoimidazole carboxamide ribotide isomerase
MAATLYAAIDLKDGACVRLRRGDMADVTVFGSDPAAQALAFVRAGCRFLHVVDLDGAVAGESRNGASVRAILQAVSVPVQVGGGVRDLTAIEAWIGLGVRRVILGSVATRDFAMVRTACRHYPGRIVVGIDAREGRVAVAGWAQLTDISVQELAGRLQDVGVAAIIHTDISRDGMLSGLNLAATERLAESVSVPVIASGGVAGIEDMRRLVASRAAAPPGHAIEGVVAGRALYDGSLDLAAALAVLDAEEGA